MLCVATVFSPIYHSRYCVFCTLVIARCMKAEYRKRKKGEKRYKKKEKKSVIMRSQAAIRCSTSFSVFLFSWVYDKKRRSSFFFF